jgi:hypothetical protein
MAIITPRRLVSVLLLGSVAGAYLRYGRPRVLNWNATDEETKRAMPGDEILPDATLQTTRAITIDATPEHIWPWLVQMGPRPRAGAYTYDWIERLFGIDIENRDEILPEFQEIHAGEFMGLNKKGEGILVREVRPREALVLQWMPAMSTWVFGLYPQPDGTTRLVSRNRLKGRGPIFWLGMRGVMEPGSLVMERKMLLGIRERAERRARSRTGTGVT